MPTEPLSGKRSVRQFGSRDSWWPRYAHCTHPRRPRTPHPDPLPIRMGRGRNWTDLGLEIPHPRPLSPPCRRPPLRQRPGADAIRGEGGMTKGTNGIPGLRCAPTWARGSQPVGPQDEERKFTAHSRSLGRVPGALRPAEAPECALRQRSRKDLRLRTRNAPQCKQPQSPKCHRGLPQGGAPPPHSRSYRSRRLCGTDSRWPSPQISASFWLSSSVAKLTFFPICWTPPLRAAPTVPRSS